MEQKEKAYVWARELCRASGEGEQFLEQFWNMLTEEDDIYEEYIYFMEHQDFLCKAKVENLTVIDIMVWQIDHFKAELDRDKEDMRTNKDKMLLMAFYTMLLMRQNAAPYLQKISSETGTDYPGKI